jgi:Family of unknown function (DUF6011)
VTATTDECCRRCQRPLHSELSRAAGYGPTCATKHLGRVPRQRQHSVPVGQLALDDTEATR